MNQSHFFSSKFISGLGLFMALSACGGSSEEQMPPERMISVGQMLPGTLTEAQPGSAQFLMGPFKRAGGVVINPRCGRLYNGLTGTVGGGTVIHVVFEVRESQLPLAIAASFGKLSAPDEAEKAEQARLIALGRVIEYDDLGIAYSGVKPYDGGLKSKCNTASLMDSIGLGL